MSLTSDGAQLTMPVMPAGTYSGGGNSGGWGDNGSWWIILFLIWAIFGIGNNGGGSAATQGALTRGDLCMDMSFQDVKSGVQNIDDAVRLGFANLNSTICSQQYDTAQMINSLGTTIQGGFNATNVAMLQGFNAIQSQAADCCCKTQSGIEGLKYTIGSEDCATRATIQNGIRDVLENQNANARAVLDKLTQQELAAKDAQISALNNQLFRADLAASQSAQNAYLVNQLRPCPVPAYITCNPYTASYGVGLTNTSAGGCGCGGYGAVA